MVIFQNSIRYHFKTTLFWFPVVIEEISQNLCIANIKNSRSDPPQSAGASPANVTFISCSITFNIFQNKTDHNLSGSRCMIAFFCFRNSIKSFFDLWKKLDLLGPDCHRHHLRVDTLQRIYLPRLHQMLHLCLWRLVMGSSSVLTDISLLAEWLNWSGQCLRAFFNICNWCISLNRFE